LYGIGEDLVGIINILKLGVKLMLFAGVFIWVVFKSYQTVSMETLSSPPVELYQAS
jgi:hypothetical protein